MSIKELKQIIENLPDNMKVLIHVKSDWYAPLKTANPNLVYYDGDVWDVNQSADDTCFDEKEWNKVKSKPKTLVLGARE